MRKGYYSEYLAKKELIKKYGRQNVIKMSIGQSSDYIILKPNEDKIEKIVEVKGTKKNKYYPGSREKEQIDLIKKLGEEHKIPVEMWFKFKNKKDFVVQIL